jgi:hypothetical protein
MTRKHINTNDALYPPHGLNVTAFIGSHTNGGLTHYTHYLFRRNLFS